MQNVAVAQNIQTVKKHEAKGKTVNHNGISFSEAVKDAVSLGKIVVPHKKNIAAQNFEKNKFLKLEDIKWDSEEEQIYNFIARIEKIIKRKK